MCTSVAALRRGLAPPLCYKSDSGGATVVGTPLLSGFSSNKTRIHRIENCHAPKHTARQKFVLPH